MTLDQKRNYPSEGLLFLPIKFLDFIGIVVEDLILMMSPQLI